MTDAETYKLDELAEQAGVSPRTVRYYVQRGLLPAPNFRGKDSSYGREHLARLRAIKRLQEQFLPLDAIQEALEGRTIEQIEAIAEGRETIAPVPAQIPQAPARVGVGTALRGSPPVWHRFQLAPGLELHLSGDADESVRELAERLMNEAVAHRPDGHGGTNQ